MGFWKTAKKVDAFGYEVEINFSQEQKKVKSKIGFVFTIVVVIAIGTYLGFRMVDMYARERTSLDVQELDRTAEDVLTPITFKNMDQLFFLGIMNTAGPNRILYEPYSIEELNKYVTVTAKVTLVRQSLNNREEEHYIGMRHCTIEDFEKYGARGVGEFNFRNRPGKSLFCFGKKLDDLYITGNTNYLA